MFWIVFTITFYITSGLFFVGFIQLHFDDYIGWDKFDKVVWCIAWMPIVIIILVALAAKSIMLLYNKIRGWFNGQKEN